MDSRQAGLPFSRPQSQQTLRDPRFASISSSQYASQPNTPRQDTLHKHDPFLRRRNDLDDLQRNTSLAPNPRQYGLPSTSNYSSNHTMAASDTTFSGSQVRRNSQGSGALFGAARMDRIGSQSSEGAGKSQEHSSLSGIPRMASSRTVNAHLRLIGCDPRWQNKHIHYTLPSATSPRGPIFLFPESTTPIFRASSTALKLRKKPPMFPYCKLSLHGTCAYLIPQMR